MKIQFDDKQKEVNMMKTKYSKVKSKLKEKEENNKAETLLFAVYNQYCNIDPPMQDAKRRLLYENIGKCKQERCDLLFSFIGKEFD